MDISDKWTQKIRNWNHILAHLSIYFDDRMSSLNIQLKKSMIFYQRGISFCKNGKIPKKDYDFIVIVFQNK